MKRAILTASVLLLALAFYWWTRGPAAPLSVSPPPETARNPAPGSAPAGTPNGNNAPSAKVAAPAPAPDVSPAFVTFLETDSRLLDSMHVDAAAAEARLNSQAAALKAPEARYARELALTDQAPANERILATALLTSPRAPFDLVRGALGDIITRGMNSGRAEPHTVDEISNVQAKSMALMAVDALAERAAKDPAAREDLLRLGNQAKDLTIRKYIEEKVRGLPPL